MDAAFCGDVVTNASWPCKTCTYVNDYTQEEFSNRRCGMCFTPMPVEGARSAKRTIIEVDLTEDSDDDTPISSHLRSDRSKFDDELDRVRVHFARPPSSESSQKKHSIPLPDNSYNVLVSKDCKLSVQELERCVSGSQISCAKSTLLILLLSLLSFALQPMRLNQQMQWTPLQWIPSIN
jgi:hypothetical protein